MKQIYKLSENAVTCYECMEFFKLLLDDDSTSMDEKMGVIKPKCIGDHEFSLYIVNKFLSELASYQNQNNNKLEEYF